MKPTGLQSMISNKLFGKKKTTPKKKPLVPVTGQPMTAATPPAPTANPYLTK